MFFKLLGAGLIGYLVGSINPSYIIGRLRGFDIRQRGSRNAGASNAVITMGKTVGIFSAFFDILKAAAVMWLMPVIFKNTVFAAKVAGVSCVLGHIFPVFMKFKGGKGVSCLGGMLLAIDWRLLLILLILEIGTILLFDYLCIMPISAAILIPLLYGVLGDSGFGILINGKTGWAGAGILAIACIAVFYKHLENLGRIRRGTELHLSYLWKKDKDAEIARVTAIESNQK